MDDEDRIALFIDYENLALGARDHLDGPFDLQPIAAALAVRGRVVVRRAYADWSYFSDDRRMLTRAHVELIEIPQRMGASRKNSADIKMAVDTIEMAFERDYISTFAVVTGDSDFTPLVHKLRELNKRVIGFGVRESTSALLPPACDEFVFYDDLDGVEPPATTTSASTRKRTARPSRPRKVGTERSDAAVEAATDRADSDADELDSGELASEESDDGAVAGPDPNVASLVAQTVSGLQRSSGGSVTASTLKRALLRKDPTFSETAYGFRAFGELLDHLAGRGVLELSPGPSKGDPEVTLPETGQRSDAFALLQRVVLEHDDGEGTALSGLKDRMRMVQPDFSEKPLGYSSFLQFCRAAESAGVVTLTTDGSGNGYRLRATSDS